MTDAEDRILAFFDLAIAEEPNKVPRLALPERRQQCPRRGRSSTASSPARAPRWMHDDGPAHHEERLPLGRRPTSLIFLDGGLAGRFARGSLRCRRPRLARQMLSLRRRILDLAFFRAARFAFHPSTGGGLLPLQALRTC